jgi:hypothetical protein
MSGSYPLHPSIADVMIERKKHPPHVAALLGSAATTMVPPPGWAWDQYLMLCVRQQQQQQHLQMITRQTPFFHGPTHFAASIQNSSPSTAAVSPVSSPPSINQNHENSSKKKPTAMVTPPLLTPATSQASPSSPPKTSLRRNSFLQRLLDLPLDTRESMFVVAIHLERSSVTRPWGLRLSSDGGDRLFLTHSASGVDVSEQWSHVAPVGRKEEQEDFIKSVYATTSVKECKNHAQDYSQQLWRAAAKGKVSSSAALQSHRRLYPGDLFLAIDGHTMSSFGSMIAVTNHLKSAQNVCLVVARHSKPMLTAVSSSSPHAKSESHSADVSGRINSAWKQIMPLSEDELFRHQSNEESSVKRMLFTKPLPVIHRNPLFKDQDGQHLTFDDYCTVSDDGTGSEYFLPPIENFQEWLVKRKATWRRRYKPYMHPGEIHKRKQHVCKKNTVAPVATDTACEDDDRFSSSVAVDFWSQQGFVSFGEWLSSRVVQWKFSYSWNQKKRKRIQEECEKVVHISDEPRQFEHWLSIRKRQWRLQRRKRQRLKTEGRVDGNSKTYVSSESFSLPRSLEETVEKAVPVTINLLNIDNKELVFMDKIIEAEEAERQKLAQKKRSLIDLAKFFDASNGIPDDIIVRCFEYFERREHVKLLAINKGTSVSLQKREDVWKSLCPKRWILPRRPRKPWHALYCDRLKREYEQRQKIWDDLLVKCAAILDSSDSLSKIEKMVTNAEISSGFDVNYVSGVVCERNSLLNLAVIHKRHKVTKWLVDTKNADIETYDRGSFTPLLNAAWEGDRNLVRFFLQRGSNRNVKGTQHYSKGIAPPGFEGMTAEQWANERGHSDIAKLIRLGY